MKKNNLIKKGVVVAVFVLFIGMSFIPSTGTTDVKQITFSSSNGDTLYFSGSGPNNNAKIKDAINDTNNDIEWSVTLNFNETDGKSDYVVFGEAPDANDGGLPDSYDAPKPPAPPTPYIRAWFDDNLPTPYDILGKDYRKYPDVYKIWNLSIQWVPSDYVTHTSVTISWNIGEVDDSEYISVILYDDGGNPLKDMFTQNSYSFTCLAITPQSFNIICKNLNYPPDVPDIDGPEYGRPGVKYTFYVEIFDPDEDSIYCMWDWDDGSYSAWLGPFGSGKVISASHSWSKGFYNIRVKAKDILGAESNWSDPLIIVMEDEPPMVEIAKPEKALYIRNRKILPRFFRKTLILGGIDVTVDAVDDFSGIDMVEFYIDNELKSVDNSSPYTYTWTRDRLRFIHLHVLKVIAYDYCGNMASDKIIVRRFL